MIKKLCVFPSCKEFALEGHNYCKKHLEESNKKREEYQKERKAFQNAKRYNEEYYHSYEWKKLRKEAIEQQPYCSICGSEDNLTVDHIIPPKDDKELFFNKYNLQVLCKNCHNKKTAYENQK